MSAQDREAWLQDNQRYLLGALAGVRAALERAALEQAPLPPAPSADHGEHYALERLCAAFRLSRFERAVLLLCAGVELDSRVARLCAQLNGDARQACATFSLALAALPEAHWSALSPAGPLRRWRLIEVSGGADTLTRAALHIDERVLHYLAGLNSLDERLQGWVRPVTAPVDLVPSQQAIAGRILAAWSGENHGSADEHVLVELTGGSAAARRAIAAAACTRLGLQLYAVDAAHLPLGPAEREALARLWEREAALSGGALLLECDDLASAEARKAAGAFAARLPGPLLLATPEALALQERFSLRLELQRPPAAEQHALWCAALGPLAQRLDGHIHALVAQFSLEPAAIAMAGAAARAEARAEPAPADADLAARLWAACRSQARLRMEELGRPVRPLASWDLLVLPELQKQTLRSIVTHVRRRARVYEQWGFAQRSNRGLGVSALFAGPSGTGKTMAAEVLAGELKLDLYRIDLSSVVSKYIGETEKNLRRLFDAAEAGGAILFFDEADALFGKRSEVQDSHDRYANIEVSYLLQRMEAYRGLAILTTNMQSALDPAFLRRLRFVVHFPFPDYEARAEIWRRIFPEATPTAGLDVAKLARLNVSGGVIHSIAMNAAFLAAEAGQAVGMAHLLQAARGEYAKLERSLTDGEIRGWVER